MKRMHLYAITLVFALYIPATAQNWDIWVPSNTGNNVIPPGNYWWVHNPATLTLLPGSTLDIFGTLFVDPGSFFLDDIGSQVNVHPGGQIVLMGNMATFQINDFAGVHMLSGSTVIMAANSVMQFAGPNGTILIDPNAFFNMNAGCQLGNIAGAGGIIECYEPRPFRGTGDLIRLIINHYVDFIVDIDYLVFKHGGTFNYDCTVPRIMNIINNGYVEYQGIPTGANTYTFIGCLGVIYVDPNCTFYANMPASMRELPIIKGQAGSYIWFYGHPTIPLNVDFVPVTGGIATEGEFIGKYTHFHGPPAPGWAGIQILGGSASIYLTNSAVMDVGITGVPAIQLWDATNPANYIEYTLIITPLMPGMNGKAIYMNSTFATVTSQLTVHCSHIHGYDWAVHNVNGNLTMTWTNIVGTVTGMQFDNSMGNIGNTCIQGCLANGLVENGNSNVTISNSNIIQNAGLQVSLTGASIANITNSAIYFAAGDIATLILQTSGTSVANVQNNWWGVFPTNPPMQFNAIPPSVINRLPELMADPMNLCDCPGFPKQFAGGKVDQPVPTGIELTNYPNPFNPSTVIEYTLPEEMHVTLRVYNLMGEVVATLVDETVSAGTHRTNFLADRSLSAGMYIYELRTPDGSFQGNMLLVK